MAATSNNKRPNISFTLPISCQICLGKVKQPVICPNQHVFCTPCLDIWLQHNQLCPTCRVPITPDSPCKQIRGGSIPLEDRRDQQFGRALRRARVDVIFDEYETEIKKLQDEIKALRSQQAEQAVHARDAVQIPASGGEGRRTESTPSSSSWSEGSREQVIQQLTVKLEEATTASEKVKREILGLKEANNKLRDENIALSIENGRLKQSLIGRSPRKYEKYAQAALQRRIDQANKEIGQLKKALTRSDTYIDEQETKLRAYQERFGDIEVKLSACIESSPQDSEYTLSCPSLDHYEEDDDILNSRSELPCFASGSDRGLVTDSGDGPSPAKRRLYMEEDDSGTKGTDSKNSRYLRGELLNTLATKSESGCRNRSCEGNSYASLEKPSPAASTPSTSFSKLQVDSECDSLEIEDSRLTPRLNVNDREKSTNANVGSGPRRVPRSLTFSWNDEEDGLQIIDSDLEEERYLSSSKGESKEAFKLQLKRNGSNVRLDNTLSNLDFTLTPEFVDCTKLLKEAEERVHGKQPNSGSTSSVTTN